MVVTKSSLKTKLYAEIKIHKALDHPNIVRFINCFEDDENVYMTLELCPSGSISSMFHRLCVFTEREARFFMVKLTGACHYMYSHQVIYRDLKLGNLFLDAFAYREPSERKKTICGTPNYIALEVLFNTADGYSFEVDIWSIGVILYTLVVRRPPFQTKDVKEVYHRYEFHSHRGVPLDTRELAQQILTPNSQERPSLHDIVDHAFFTHGVVPGYIPISARDMNPDFRHLSSLISLVNLPVAAAQVLQAASRSKSVNFLRGCSPISALLSSARQPLMVAPSGISAPCGKPTLLLKLQVTKKEAVKSPAKFTSRLRGSRRKSVLRWKCRGKKRGRKSCRVRRMRRMHLHQCQRPHKASDMPECARRSSGGSVVTTPTPATPKVNGFDAAVETLCTAFDTFSHSLLFRDPSDNVDMPEERVFIAPWVAMHSRIARFNDNNARPTDKQHFDSISLRYQGTVYVRKNYTVTNYPKELKCKVYHLKHFWGYTMGKLYGDYIFGFATYQVHALRAKVLPSNESCDCIQVTRRPPGVLTRWTLSQDYQVMEQALVPPSDPEQAKFGQWLLDKLRYRKEVPLSTRNVIASASSGGSGENGLVSVQSRRRHP
ncbi:Pkinase-domain-containing protein [Lactarius sanguifluus]|nr:Pkinase-domain-containing protein [Lactarius sanguifluus]